MPTYEYECDACGHTFEEFQTSNFSARGFGEYEPIDTNSTEEGRKHNRRVEVLISPDAESLNIP